jgi:hypothetical protein
MAFAGALINDDSQQVHAPRSAPAKATIEINR